MKRHALIECATVIIVKFSSFNGNHVPLFLFKDAFIYKMLGQNDRFRLKKLKQVNRESGFREPLKSNTKLYRYLYLHYILGTIVLMGLCHSHIWYQGDGKHIKG